MKEDSAFGIILFVVFILWMWMPTSEMEEKTIYFSYCPDFKHNSYSCPEKLGFMKISYRIYLKEQLVVSKSLTDLMPCRVFDKDNWECQANGNVQSMQDGNYRETAGIDAGSLDENGKKSILPRYQQIPSLVYHIRSTINFFRNFL